MSIGTAIYRTITCSDSLVWAYTHLSFVPDGTLFMAEQLLHAHGRQGRTWQTADGQLLLTMVLKPQLHQQILTDLCIRNLTMALCLGIFDALKGYDIKIKWPNDFMYENKKIGGMLSKLSWEGEKLQGMIVGIGINLNNSWRADDPLNEHATSLITSTKKIINHSIFEQHLISSMDHWYKTWQKGHREHIYETWRTRQHYRFRYLSLHHYDGSVTSGHMKDVLPNGDLLLFTDTEQLQIIPFAAVYDVKTGLE